MSGAGDLNSRVRRPSPPGANTQVLFNAAGIEGASPNLTFNVSSNTLNVFMLNVSANIANTGNLLVTQNTATGNLSVTTLANVGTANIVGLISPNATTYLNGTSAVASANQNFNNTATIQVTISANGSQANIGFNQLVPLSAPASNRALALTDAQGIIYQNTATLVAIYLPTQTNVAMPLGTRITLIVRGTANIQLSPNSNVTLFTVNAHSGNLLSGNTVAQSGNMNLTPNSVSQLYLTETFGNVWMMDTTA